jgi:hypothetical protein
VRPGSARFRERSSPRAPTRGGPLGGIPLATGGGTCRVDPPRGTGRRGARGGVRVALHARARRKQSAAGPECGPSEGPRSFRSEAAPSEPSPGPPILKPALRVYAPSLFLESVVITDHAGEKPACRADEVNPCPELAPPFEGPVNSSASSQAAVRRVSHACTCEIRELAEGRGQRQRTNPCSGPEATRSTLHARRQPNGNQGATG